MIKNNFRMNFSIKILSCIKQYFFKDVKYYLQSGIHSRLNLQYPCTIFVNNVEERDIFLISVLDKIFNLRTKIFFPLKKDLPHRIFLKEAKTIPRKIIRFIILKLSLIPIFLRLAGGLYLIKDLFTLLKTIKRNTSYSIYERFDFFKMQILKRKIFVLFGYELGLSEGEISTTSGILRVFNEKNPDMNYIQMTLTYDYLLSKEGIVHISHSGIFKMKPEKPISSIAATLKLKRSLGTTVTPGNLFSFAIYSPEVQNGVSRQYLFYKMERLANMIYSEKYCNISRECLEMSYDELFAEILFNAKKDEFIKYEKDSKQYYGTNKLYYFKKYKYNNLNLKNENIYRYHYMQLNLFHKKFRQIWTEIEVYD